MSSSGAGLVAGKYRLGAPLSRGGMGTLWLAHHVDLDAEVVVKRPLSELLSSTELDRFQREARVLARLRSTHIVQVLDFGVDDEGPFLVMERLRGRDLSDHLAESGALSVRAAGELFGQLARALRALHAEGIVHRDIKPSNLFLASEPGREEPVLKVLDFGIVRPVTLPAGTPSMTASRAILGSPGYISPEQVFAGPVDLRADLWAAAAVLYEMLSGKCPFAAAHLLDSLKLTTQGTHEPVTTSQPRLRPELDVFFQRAFAVEPALRFQTIDELARAAQSCLELDAPLLVEVRPPVDATGSTLAEHSSAPRLPRSDATRTLRPLSSEGESLAADPSTGAATRRPMRARSLGLVALGLAAAGVASFFLVSARGPEPVADAEVRSAPSSGAPRRELPSPASPALGSNSRGEGPAAPESRTLEPVARPVPVPAAPASAPSVPLKTLSHAPSKTTGALSPSNRPAAERSNALAAPSPSSRAPSPPGASATEPPLAAAPDRGAKGESEPDPSDGPETRRDPFTGVYIPR